MLAATAAAFRRTLNSRRVNFCQRLCVNKSCKLCTFYIWLWRAAFSFVAAAKEWKSQQRSLLVRLPISPRNTYTHSLQRRWKWSRTHTHCSLQVSLDSLDFALVPAQSLVIRRILEDGGVESQKLRWKMKGQQWWERGSCRPEAVCWSFHRSHHQKLMTIYRSRRRHI